MGEILAREKKKRETEANRKRNLQCEISYPIFVIRQPRLLRVAIIAEPCSSKVGAQNDDIISHFSGRIYNSPNGTLQFSIYFMLDIAHACLAHLY